ncbi:hypothetical protein Ptr902_04350 [Pyrenophora tritici-repentis]|nr:hypothetical protein Ptr902_04350 [Pyrenophora tritici-repentis]
MRSTTNMNDLSEMLSQPPPGVDPDFQAKVFALFSQPAPNNNTTHKGPRDTPVPTLENAQSCPCDTPHQPSYINPLPQRCRMTPMTAAHFDYPSESHAKGAEHSASTAAITHVKSAPPLEPPSISTLIISTTYMIGEYMNSYIESFSQPAIIEYAPWEIEQRSNIQIQAQVSDSTSVEGSGTQEPEKVVKVMAVVGGSQEQRVVAITAKPKRIKEILKTAGYKLTENTYKEQIHEAMKRLRG